MKRCIVLILTAVLLLGCQRQGEDLNNALSIRNKLLSSNGYQFDAVISADYGDKIYTFGMTCVVTGDGALSFTVTSPESISGITGKISDSGGALTFDDKILAFETIADGLVSPVTAPWLILHTLRGGYIQSACREDGLLHLTIDDSYQENDVETEIWLDSNDLPLRGEITWKGRRILTVDVKNFVYL